MSASCSSHLPVPESAHELTIARAPTRLTASAPAPSLLLPSELELFPVGTDADESVNSQTDTSESADADGEANGSELVSLPVPGFQAAVLAVPRGDAPFRLMVATHGAGGDPETTCVSWARRTRGHVLIACPRGRAMSVLEPHGFYYPDHHTLEAEVLAVLAASEERYAARLSDAGALYSGFSQGATMGALFLPERAARFSALVLTEGGYGDWTQRTARRFRSAGGERVLFVCGTRYCAENVAKSARVLESAGVAVRTEHVSGGGHTDRGSVGERLDALVDWAFSRQP